MSCEETCQGAVTRLQLPADWQTHRSPETGHWLDHSLPSSHLSMVYAASLLVTEWNSAYRCPLYLQFLYPWYGSPVDTRAHLYFFMLLFQLIKENTHLVHLPSADDVQTPNGRRFLLDKRYWHCIPFIDRIWKNCAWSYSMRAVCLGEAPRKREMGNSIQSLLFIWWNVNVEMEAFP